MTYRDRVELSGYIPAGDKWMAPVKLKDDNREWFYTAKKMYKGSMHARVVTRTGHLGGEGKKLIPIDKVTFLNL